MNSVLNHLTRGLPFWFYVAKEAGTVKVTVDLALQLLSKQKWQMLLMYHIYSNKHSLSNKHPLPLFMAKSGQMPSKMALGY